VRPLNDVRLSEHFVLREFACPCCRVVMLQPELLSALQRLRNLWGEPVILTSGYRCRAHNAAVGGVEDSAHRKGRAADVAVAAVWQPKVIALAGQAGFAAILPYPRRHFIHLAV